MPIPIPTALSFPTATNMSIPIPTALSFSLVNISVVNDVSRPGSVAIGEKDVIHRSLPEVVLYDTGSQLAYGRRVGSGKTGPHRIVRKRRLHDTLVQTRQRRSLYHVLSLILVAIVLLGVLVPLGT